MRRAIFDEWCAQVGTLQAAGTVVSHLDSHHHVHCIPALFSLVKRLQRRFTIDAVRLGLE
ncbi:MAG: ChbG/HpnK family deacetylase, partial [Magnetococcales bacterium]|nr:ChbG/HpnK family deacetylase [Magnetococcales bacterium]